MFSLFTDAFNMIQDLRRETPAIGTWGGLLNIPQVLGGLLFYARVESWIVVVTCAVPVLIAAQMHKRTPFSRLTSIVHIPWLGVLPYIIYVLASEGIASPFHYWLTYVAGVIAISLVLDIRNLWLYFSSKDAKFEGATS